MLDVEHLSYTIGERKILDDISFSLTEGAITCVIGPNGCGKSTLLSHISRRLPSHGTVSYEGKKLEDWPPSEYARHVAVMVQQGMGMASGLKAEDVVLMGRYPFKKKFMDYTDEDRAIARSMMEETGALSLWGRNMGRLSGGEKQRILIAKAFTQQPDLLLMDEPTNHLDVKYKIGLMEHLTRFKKRGTVLIVLHDLGLAARYADEAILMKAGHLIAHGKTSEVMTEEKLSELFEVPFYTSMHEGKRFVYC